MPARGEPIQQTPLFGAEIGARDADLLESQRLAPAPDVGGKRGPIAFFGCAWTGHGHVPEPTPRRCPRSATASLYLRDATGTEAAGARLAGELRDGMIVTLSGDLGAGKTTLVRGCLKALGWTGPVKSPSYPLVEHYPLSRLYLYHFDFYRFADPDEWETAGLADCFGRDAVCLIEWPERIAGRLPAPDLALALRYPADASLAGRELALEAHTEGGERCLTAMISVGTSQPA